MIASAFREGLVLLLGYNNRDRYCVDAEHDIIYVAPTCRPLSQEDVKRLYELGWFQPDVDNDGNDPALYDENECWAASP